MTAARANFPARPLRYLDTASGMLYSERNASLKVCFVCDSCKAPIQPASITKKERYIFFILCDFNCSLNTSWYSVVPVHLFFQSLLYSSLPLCCSLRASSMSRSLYHKRAASAWAPANFTTEPYCTLNADVAFVMRAPCRHSQRCAGTGNNKKEAGCWVPPCVSSPLVWGQQSVCTLSRRTTFAFPLSAPSSLWCAVHWVHSSVTMKERSLCRPNPLFSLLRKIRSPVHFSSDEVTQWWLINRHH